ncbi:hypothetical protein R5R35_007950 [Gryllus longicercus]|uniref:Exosome complex component RRP45 n=1 Tax=Gryllus longicercus TaxID=2509291 RepID=A0AAN9V6J4_9ORTH
MKESILSISEKTFILSALSETRRLDGRKLDEFRPMKIHFGSDWGCCIVTLGQTKVIAQVSCEVQQPKPTRPNEGLLLLFVELSPMGAPHFEAGRQSDLAVQLNRLLEKCIKDSRCVDLESLCITAEEKVWAVRVDVNILNHEGNLVDAASLAALTALSHFRRPDVTTTGEQTIIHDPAERDPIPITLHHHPVCVSYAVFDKGNHVIADPTAIEERVSEGQIVFGVNAYRELCGLHLGGNAPITLEMVNKYATRAAKRALELVTQMKKALAEDLKNRISGIEVGFRDCIDSNNRLSLGKDNFQIQLFTPDFKKERAKRASNIDVKEEKINDVMDDSSEDDSEPVIVSVGKGSAELVNQKKQDMKLRRKRKLQNDEGGKEYDVDESSSSEESDNLDKESEDTRKNGEPMSDSEIQVVAEYKGTENKPNENKVIANIELSGDSEEEETVLLHGEDLKNGSTEKGRGRCPKEEKMEGDEPHSRGWYSKPTW